MLIEFIITDPNDKRKKYVVRFNDTNEALIYLYATIKGFNRVGYKVELKE